MLGVEGLVVDPPFLKNAIKTESATIATQELKQTFDR